MEMYFETHGAGEPLLLLHGGASSALTGDLSSRSRTLIVHGDRDPLYPVNLATETYAAIPRSYLWVIPNGGHGLIFGEMADRFVKTALAFLRGEWVDE